MNEVCILNTKIVSKLFLDFMLKEIFKNIKSKINRKNFVFQTILNGLYCNKTLISSLAAKIYFNTRNFLSYRKYNVTLVHD